MKLEQRILSLFGGDSTATGRMPILADLRLWYRWHEARQSIPEELGTTEYPGVCRALGLPVVEYLRPWRIEHGKAVDERSEIASERTWTFGTEGRTLSARWAIGPDGDYWQTRYPAATEADLEVVEAYLDERTIIAEPFEPADIEDDVVRIIELPARPFSWMMLEILGWSEGLMLLLDSQERIERILEKAEAQVASAANAMVEGFAQSLFLSPDNLDGQFVSPTFFNQYLSQSYAKLADTLHRGGHRFAVHAGGPVSGLITPLADSAVDCIYGVSEPPQGDAGIKATVEKSGRRIVPWGGIPQDLLLWAMHEATALAQAEAIIEEANANAPAVLGIADHVPLDADISRLKRIVAMAD